MIILILTLETLLFLFLLMTTGSVTWSLIDYLQRPAPHSFLLLSAFPVEGGLPLFGEQVPGRQRADVTLPAVYEG